MISFLKVFTVLKGMMTYIGGGVSTRVGQSASNVHCKKEGVIELQNKIWMKFSRHRVVVTTPLNVYKNSSNTLNFVSRRTLDTFYPQN